jgi:hypothetical protein
MVRCSFEQSLNLTAICEVGTMDGSSHMNLSCFAMLEVKWHRAR